MRTTFLFGTKVCFEICSNSADVSKKAEDAYTTVAPDPCSQFLVRVRVVHLTFVALYVLFWLLYVLCVVCLFSLPVLLSCLCHWIT